MMMIMGNHRLMPQPLEMGPGPLPGFLAGSIIIEGAVQDMQFALRAEKMKKARHQAFKVFEVLHASGQQNHVEAGWRKKVLEQVSENEEQIRVFGEDPRPLLELLAAGRRRGRTSDPDQLARLTRIPAVLWILLLLVASLAGLVVGVSTLAPDLV